jgi:hypothetical protein
MVVLKSSTTSFAIYRHQAKIFVVPADGLVSIAAKEFLRRQEIIEWE